MCRIELKNWYWINIIGVRRFKVPMCEIEYKDKTSKNTRHCWVSMKDLIIKKG